MIQIVINSMIKLKGKNDSNRWIQLNQWFKPWLNQWLTERKKNDSNQWMIKSMIQILIKWGEKRKKIRFKSWFNECSFASSSPIKSQAGDAYPSIKTPFSVTFFNRIFDYQILNECLSRIFVENRSNGHASTSVKNRPRMNGPCTHPFYSKLGRVNWKPSNCLCVNIICDSPRRHKHCKISFNPKRKKIKKATSYFHLRYIPEETVPLSTAFELNKCCSTSFICKTIGRVFIAEKKNSNIRLLLFTLCSSQL